MFNIVLVEPEIPQNTGNVSRTCAATHSVLHLVRPLGFEISDRTLKRAGLDYWQYLDVRYYDSFDELVAKNAGANFYYLSTKGKIVYSDAKFKDGDFLVFGCESAGLGDEILEKYRDRTRFLPMLDGRVRSLNLASAATAAVFEAMKQTDFFEG